MTNNKTLAKGKICLVVITSVLFVGVATIVTSTDALEITTRSNPFFSEVYAQTTSNPSSGAINSNKSLEQLQSQISNLQKQYDIQNKQISNLQGNISEIQSDKVSRSDLENLPQDLEQLRTFDNNINQYLMDNPWVVRNCLIDAANHATQSGNQFSEFAAFLNENC